MVHMTVNVFMLFDKHKHCNDIAQKQKAFFMDDKYLKRRWIFKINKSL